MSKSKALIVITLGLAPLSLGCGSTNSDINEASPEQSAGGSDANVAGSGSGATTAGGRDSNGSGSGGSGSGAQPTTDKFSFFVTSLKAMRELSGNEDGFGGDLRFGETGDGAGLRGADKICTTIAEKSMPGNGKTWRAFLSATAGEDGMPVNAIDRVGEGPWYDRTGRLLAQNKTDLATERPTGADSAIVNDLPNEDGVPNHAPDASGEVDNHDFLTGTNDQGALFSSDAGFTCNDWTSAVGGDGTPRCGHSWPRQGGPGGGGGPGGSGPGGGMNGSGNNWMSALNEAGCAPGAFVIEMGPPGANGTQSVGDGGGYGGIYCFALTP
ncbi:MAG TPA: hypothetical protein VHB79_36540 [Polyangiaceae bacterium]|nr:hypothetical protein [Polyangiaceae bacterium]